MTRPTDITSISVVAKEILVRAGIQASLNTGPVVGKPVLNVRVQGRIGPNQEIIAPSTSEERRDLCSQVEHLLTGPAVPESVRAIPKSIGFLMNVRAF
jgi:hypothetical protein